MAIYKIFPLQDTTLYTIYPTSNTGIDAICEVSNTLDISGTPQVARYLSLYDNVEIYAYLRCASFNCLIV